MLVASHSNKERYMKNLISLFGIALLAFPAQAQPGPSASEGLPPALRQEIAQRIAGCWQFNAQDWKGIAPAPIAVRIDYDPAGKARNVRLAVKDEQRYRKEAPFRLPALKALQAAAVCDLTDLHLPQQLYPVWKEMQFNFDPAQAATLNNNPPRPRPRNPDAQLEKQMNVIEVK